MPARPIVLSPASPSEVLSYILLRHTYPTTVLVGTSKEDFLQALREDVKQQLPEAATDEPSHDILPPFDTHTSHPLLQASLMQVAVSRHIRTAFIPSVTHLRAYLSIFAAEDSKTPAPPNMRPSPSYEPLLLVYGFLELHRDASEWSAQGIGRSLAALVEGAARNGFRAAIVEPKVQRDVDRGLAEEIPLLNGTPLKDDGTWTGRTVPVRRVLGRWFEFEAHKGELELESS